MNVKIFICRILIVGWMFLLPASILSAEDHQQFGVLLTKYNQAGHVDYAGFKRDEIRLDAYLEGLAKIDPESLPREERFAFYINAYNAWTIKLILSGYPGVTSIKKLGSLFKSPWKEIRYMSAAFLSGSVKTSTTTSSAFSKSTHLAS